MSPVRQIREAAGLSVQELADRLGVSRDAVYQAERRGDNTTVEYLRRVAAVCGLKLEIKVTR